MSSVSPHGNRRPAADVTHVRKHDTFEGAQRFIEPDTLSLCLRIPTYELPKPCEIPFNPLPAWREWTAPLSWTGRRPR